MTHICVCKLTIIGSDNGLSPGQRQAIIWTNAGILLIGPLGTNFSEISVKVHIFSFMKVHLKMSSVKWQPSCLGLNVLRRQDDYMTSLQLFTAVHLLGQGGVWIGELFAHHFEGYLTTSMTTIWLPQHRWRMYIDNTSKIRQNKNWVSISWYVLLSYKSNQLFLHIVPNEAGWYRNDICPYLFWTWQCLNMA